MTSDARLEAPTERLARLERERLDADRRYNDALTRLDGALLSSPALPDPPAPYDATKLAAINDGWNVLPEGPPDIDRSFKGRLRGLVWRLVGPPLERQRQFNAALVDHLNRNAPVHTGARQALSDTLAALRDHADRTARFHAELIRYLQTVTLYVDSKDRAIGSQPAIEDLRAMALVAQRTALSLKRDVERLIAGAGVAADRAETIAPAPGPSNLDAFKYVGFQDAFRGPEQEIRRKLEFYVPMFTGQSEVLDVGCGRGEFLELLRERHIAAKGLDTNPAMVEECRARGLDVVAADALSYLSAVPDASLGGIFSSQVVEHLAPDYLLKLIETAHHKLRAGGLIVLETINPACWSAFFNAYIRDVTHVRPLHPDTLHYFLRINGFVDVAVEYRSPVPESDRLHALPDSAAASDDVKRIAAVFNANVAALNARMFTYQDYAVTARR